MKPLVSVIISTRNRVIPLIRALRSIQNQSWSRLEILVLDDASNNDTPFFLESISRIDSRIKWKRREVSQGLATALNELIASSHGQWLARMDDDDISHPRRIETQLGWMETHKVDVAGTWCRRRSLLGHSIARPPNDDETLRAELLFQPRLFHPSVMLRRSVVERVGGYPTDYPHAEDYALWVRLAPIARFGNVPEVLLDYRLSPHQVSRRYNAAQVDSARRIRREYLELLDIPCTPEEHEVHLHLRDPVPIETLQQLDAIDAWLQELQAQYPSDIERTISRQWFLACVRAAGLGTEVYRHFERSSLSQGVSGNKRLILEMLCKIRLRYRGLPYRWLEPLVPA